MDANAYKAAKTKGQARIIIHGEQTLLISVPGGFDPATGEALPPIERGYQPADIDAVVASALAAQSSAMEALQKASDTVAAARELLDDAKAALDAHAKNG